MAVQLTPSKRRNDCNEPNVGGKWQKTAAFTSQNVGIPPKTTFFRILFPASKGGSGISKGGGIIDEISQETGAIVTAEETVSGCDETVIVIVEPDRENGGGSNQTREEGKNTGDKGGCEQNKEEEEKNTSDKVDEQENEGKDKQSVAAGDSGSGKGPSAAQIALLLVFEKIAERKQTDGGNEENQKASIFTVRLLVRSTQVGCILGKQGSRIKQMASESGAQIRIIPTDKKPICASSVDDVVQITGSLYTVRRALLCVSQQLMVYPLRFDKSLVINTSRLSSHSSSHPSLRPEAYPARNYPFPSQGPPNVGPHDSENVILGRMNPSRYILTFRLLCPHEKAGCVIGKGGSIVKALEHVSGCEIKVLDGSVSEDCVVIISGPAHPNDEISAPQDAVLRVQSRIVRASPEGKENTAIAKILISSNQIGCLLGKGGAIMTEMRKYTGAYIGILAKDQIPKCASANEEAVQIMGEFGQVQEALLQITYRLREHIFRNAFPFMKHPLNQAFTDQGPPFPIHMGRTELSPPRMYSSLGPSIQKINAGWPPMHGGSDLHDDYSHVPHNIHRPDFPPHISERMPPAAIWGHQGPSEGVGPIGLPEYPGGTHRKMSEFGGGSRQAIITSTTLEVVVPLSAVPAIYGEDGGCLKQIREISDAKITIINPKPGASETAIIISGTPDQAYAAQSLVHAFVISESNAA